MFSQPKYQVVYNGETFTFQHGSQLYIFDYALYHDIHKLGIDVLKRFVGFVHNCYMKDCNPTPLGALTDYVADNWDDRNQNQIGSHDVLENFYLQLY